VRYVTVSQAAQRAYLAATGFEPRAIPCGLDLEAVPFVSNEGSYFVFVGRISAEKGLLAAIEAVKKRGMEKLIVIGRVYDEDLMKLLTTEFEHPLIEYLGALPNAEVLRYLGHARALVLPVREGESFGLVYLESLATGTPVITSALGAAPEIVQEGINGYLLKAEGELGDALSKISVIERVKCRESVLEKFSLERMLNEYSKLYSLLLSEVSTSGRGLERPL